MEDRVNTVAARSVLVYDPETWPVIDFWCLHSIVGIRWENSPNNLKIKDKVLDLRVRPLEEALS